MYPKAEYQVSNLMVKEEVPNTNSIEASLEDYEILNDIREIPLSEFEVNSLHDLFYSSDDFRRTEKLAEEIEQNGWISPLIIVIDKDGPYILEGAHRFGALLLLEKKSFPALVVLDLESVRNYCFCPADDGLLYVEFPNADQLITLLLQQKFRNVAHFRTRHGYVPYSGGGIAFNAQSMYLKGVKPLWFLRSFGDYNYAIEQLIEDSIYQNKREAERHYESQYVKECEWKGPIGLRFDLNDVEFVWLGSKKLKRDIKKEIKTLFPNIPILKEPPESVTNPCVEIL